MKKKKTTKKQTNKQTNKLDRTNGTGEESPQCRKDVLLENRRETGKKCLPAVCKRERNVLFNDALNTFYLRLFGVRHMVKDHSDSERGNPLPPHGLLFPISSKGSFICTITQTG